jgi:hypothetical protein
MLSGESAAQSVGLLGESTWLARYSIRNGLNHDKEHLETEFA